MLRKTLKKLCNACELLKSSVAQICICKIIYLMACFVIYSRIFEIYGNTIYIIRNLYKIAVKSARIGILIGIVGSIYRRVFCLYLRLCRRELFSVINFALACKSYTVLDLRKSYIVILYKRGIGFCRKLRYKLISFFSQAAGGFKCLCKT